VNEPAQVKPSNKRFTLVLLPFLILTIIVVSHNLHKPFNLDEADFATAAHHLMGDAKYFSEHPEGGLWHPPLYLHSLAAVFQIFGETTAAARGLGFLLYILTIVFTVLICKELFEPKEYRFISVIAACLCLINPLSLQFAFLIDIDGSLLTFLMTVFCYFFVRFNKRGMNMKRTVMLGFLFGLCMLAKFTTPPVILPAVFLFYFLGRKYKKAFLQTFLIFLFGIIFFWSLWHAYCLIFDVQVLYPFKYTLGSKMGQGGFGINPQKIMLIKGSLIYQMYWVSPAFVMLMVLSIAGRVGTFIKEKTVDDVDFLMILGMGIFLFYIYYFPRLSMMKYQTPCYPLFIIVISRFLYNVLIKDRRVNMIEMIVICVCTITAFVYYLGNFPDMILWVDHGKNVVSEFFENNYNIFLHLYFLPFLLLPLLFYFIFEKKTFCFSLTAAILLLTVNMQVVQNIKQTEDYTTANSWHNYGERGQAQATDYLNKKLSADGATIMRKDIAYYLLTNPKGVSTRKYIYNGILRGPKQKAQAALNKAMKEDHIEYVQLDIYSSIRNSLEILEPYYKLDKQFGNFIILKKK